MRAAENFRVSIFMKSNEISLLKSFPDRIQLRRIGFTFMLGIKIRNTKFHKFQRIMLMRVKGKMVSLYISWDWKRKSRRLGNRSRKAFLCEIYLSCLSRACFLAILNLERENDLEIRGKSLREMFSRLTILKECLCILATHKLVDGKFFHVKLPRTQHNWW